MQQITLHIVGLIGDAYGTEASDGQKIFELISRAFTEGKQVNLSFQNLEMVTTSFLNTAVGQLYRDYPESFIRENLKVTHISEAGKVALKRVVDTAKIFYMDPEALGRSILEIVEN